MQGCNGRLLAMNSWPLAVSFVFWVAAASFPICCVFAAWFSFAITAASGWTVEEWGAGTKQCGRESSRADGERQKIGIIHCWVGMWW